MNAILFFDVETTGLLDFRKPADDPSQPRVCALAAILEKPDADETEQVIDLLVRPDGWTIPDEATAIHGLTTEHCADEGTPIADILDLFAGLYDEADLVAGFNVNFDLKMLRGEFRRSGIDDRYGAVPHFCVMQAARPICRIPPSNGMMATGRKTWKTPKLEEAVRILLKREHAEAHTALADTEAARDLYRFLETNHPDAIRPKRARSSRSKPRDKTAPSLDPLGDI